MRNSVASALLKRTSNCVGSPAWLQTTGWAFVCQPTQKVCLLVCSLCLFDWLLACMHACLLACLLVGLLVCWFVGLFVCFFVCACAVFVSWFLSLSLCLCCACACVLSVCRVSPGQGNDHPGAASKEGGLHPQVGERLD